MQVEYRCEYSPVEVKVWVEKDMKTKEVTVLPTPKIIRVSCGPQHTVAVADNHKAYSWGFGGYGRLGHSETGNEMVPRLIASLSGKNRGVKDVVCGASFNLGICEIPGMVNMWGIYTPAKEANMYAKPISDLSGWNTRAIACNTKVTTPNLDFVIVAYLPSDAMPERFTYPLSGLGGSGGRRGDRLHALALHGRTRQWGEEEELCGAVYGGYAGGLLRAAAGGRACPYALRRSQLL